MTDELSANSEVPNPPRLEFVGDPLSAGMQPVRGAAVNSSYGYAGATLAPSETHLLNYVKVLYKRRWVATTSFLLVLISVALYTFTTTPIYEAKVQVLIEKENENVVNFKEAYEQNQVADDYYQTQYKILQSRALARRTIDELDLWKSARLTSADAAGPMFRRLLAAPMAIFRGSSAQVKSAELATADETKLESTTIDRFLSALTILPVRNSRLVDVRFESPDPALATSVANTLAKSYIEQNLEYKFTASKDASDWLGQRLAEQRKKVEASEQALQRYREQSDAMSLEDRQNIVVQKLSDLNTAVTRAKTERIQKESAYDQIKVSQNDRNAIDSIPAILSNIFIQQQKSELADLQRQQAQLAEKLGSNHPDMIKVAAAIRTADAKIQGEIAKVVQSMRNDYQASLAQEQSLMSALDQQKRDALALNRKGIDYASLQRDANTNRQIFESLLQRTKETGISGELRTSNIRVVDAAELPRRPIRPNTLNNMGLAFAGGLTLAIGLAFFFEYIDSRIKSPEEIKEHLGLSFLGMVPALFDVVAGNPMINNGVPANFSESFRAIRTNVLFSGADAAGRSMVVTSTGPGEGKTVVAVNLAIALAQAGLRVLLVDADMRKPRVHTVFAKPQQPGLSNVMVGNSKASEAVQQTTIPGLWVLAAGLHPPNPAELLGSKRFKDFLATLIQHFDYIIIDSPPVMAVTDSAVIAHLATGVFFVVGSEMTSRHAAQRALEQLEQAKARFVGAVLNRVDLKHNAYYYSQYYRREYSNYYNDDDQLREQSSR